MGVERVLGKGVEDLGRRKRTFERSFRLLKKGGIKKGGCQKGFLERD